MEALGKYFENIGVAFQIIDDVLNLRGFEGKTKECGEDIKAGKVRHCAPDSSILGVVSYA